jgi:hypothetical protein
VRQRSGIETPNRKLNAIQCPPSPTIAPSGMSAVACSSGGGISWKGSASTKSPILRLGINVTAFPYTEIRPLSQQSRPGLDARGVIKPPLGAFLVALVLGGGVHRPGGKLAFQEGLHRNVGCFARLSARQSRR